MRRRREEGRIKIKIRSLMLDSGWDIVLWREQQGDYRIHKYHWDLACWGCHAKATRDFPHAPKGFVVDQEADLADLARGFIGGEGPVVRSDSDLHNGDHERDLGRNGK